MEIRKKQKFTPKRMLDVLNEINILCNKNEFLPKNYCKKQPSVWHFTRVLIKMGVLSKVNQEYIWNSGEPNIQMAKHVIDLSNQYYKNKKEQYRAKIKNTQKLIPETIEFPTSEFPLELERYEPIKEDLVDIKEDYSSALKDFKEDLDEANAKISILRVQNKELFNNNSSLLNTNKDLEKQLAEYELEVSDLLKGNGELKYQIDKMQEAQKQKKSKHRKVKFLGITIFKIEQ
jgi:hypothetical protein